MNRRAAWLAPVLVSVILLGGCAPQNTDLSSDAAAQMQTMVVSVAETAATSDHAAAIAQLDLLQAELHAARGRGDVSEERAASIQAAIDLVRADLVQASVPEPEPSEAPAVEPTTDVIPGNDDAEDGGGDRGPGNGPGDGGPGEGNGNKGNGNKGNGNDGDKGNGPGGNRGNGNR
ncbi:hypothetical protein [Microbacterium sp. CJ77]|uniref:hypothetical protein n=1 Tax=Microbacterium sp. CJ77 TaxID=2079201 RepID=UPI0015E185FE|nr:hypothetical protein [Microbacterium sp. CJ77]